MTEERSFGMRTTQAQRRETEVNRSGIQLFVTMILFLVAILISVTGSLMNFLSPKI